MNTSQTITLMVIVAALVGSMTYYNLKKEDPPFSKGDADCESSATTLPLVNVATGIGITATIAECE